MAIHNFSILCTVTVEKVRLKARFPLTSFEGELTSAGDSVQAVGEHQLVGSEESLEKPKRDEVKRSIHDEVKSDGGYALDIREF